MKRRIKRFVRDNKWAILSILGILTWMLLLLGVLAGAEDVISFYVTMSNLAG